MSRLKRSRILVVALGLLCFVAVGIVLRRQDGPVAPQSAPPAVAKPASIPTPAPAAERAPDPKPAKPAKRLAPPKLVAPKADQERPYVATAIRQFKLNPQDPNVYFKDEKRNEPWASAMEDALRKRIAAITLDKKLPGFKTERVECRESICKLQVRYGEADEEVARNQGAFDPWLLVRDSAGVRGLIYLDKVPPAERKAVDPAAWVQDDGSTRKFVVLVLSQESMDPKKVADGEP